MKKNLAILITFFLLAQMIVSVHGKDYPQKYWDVAKDHWAFEYIADLSTRNVINGYEDGSFQPEATVSRSEWAKMMCVAGNLVVSDDSVYFRDTENHWANKYVNAAQNYITSYNDGSFRPDQAIVREDVTRSLVTLRGYDIKNVDYSYISNFRDTDSISNYMKAYVAVAVEKGLITGFEDNTFRGQDTLTRAEAATLLYRAFQKGDASKVTYEKTVATPSINEEIKDTADNQGTSDNTKNEPNNTGSNSSSQTNNNYEENNENSTATATNPVTSNKSESSSGRKHLSDVTNKVDNNIKEEEEDNEEVKVILDDDFKVLAEADLTVGDQISFDGKDTIYYMKDKKVFSMNIYTYAVECLVDTSTFEVDNEYAYKSDFTIISICYDNLTGGVIILGWYETVNSATDKGEVYMYLVTDDDVEVLFEGVPENFLYLFQTLENGDFVSDTTIYDRKTFEANYNYVSYIPTNHGISWWGHAYSVAESDDGITCVGVYEYDIDKAWGKSKAVVTHYDFSEYNTLWELPAKGFGIYENKVVGYSDYIFEVYTTKGKLLSTINLKEYVKGKVCNVMKRLILTDEYIVYYDFKSHTINKVAY